jgi:hypothetical protein
VILTVSINRHPANAALCDVQRNSGNNNSSTMRHGLPEMFWDGYPNSRSLGKGCDYISALREGAHT